MKGYNLSEVLVYMRVGNGMYARRGGVSYLKDMAEFRKIMLNSGYINLLEFLTSVKYETPPRLAYMPLPTLMYTSTSENYIPSSRLRANGAIDNNPQIHENPYNFQLL